MMQPLKKICVFIHEEKNDVGDLIVCKESYSRSLGLSLDSVKPLGNDIMEI
jgi:hypothetical protein